MPLQNADMYHFAVEEVNVNADLLMYAVLRAHTHFFPSSSQVVPTSGTL